MEPTEDYELNGFFGNVVFTNGHVVNGDSLCDFTTAPAMK